MLYKNGSRLKLKTIEVIRIITKVGYFERSVTFGILVDDTSDVSERVQNYRNLFLI